jgi:magnesium-transporting ATPase (P-type)
LDGEKNLKPKEPAGFSVDKYFPDEPVKIIGTVTCELPNPKLYNFDGSIEVRGLCYSLDKKQLLLCGAVLRNTRWAIGVVVYTGNDTKLRRNSESRTIKLSQVERKMNKCIIVIMTV